MTTLSVPRIHVVGAASVRYFVKLAVVPEPSERWTTTMAVDGSVAFGLSALIFASVGRFGPLGQAEAASL